jgi:hypothetical protein
VQVHICAQSVHYISPLLLPTMHVAGMDVKHVCTLVMIMATGMMVASVFMPWATEESGLVHIRYTATDVRACAGGRFCRTLEWANVDRLDIVLRDIVELALEVTHLDTITRADQTAAHLNVKIPRHPIDVVYTVSPVILALAATTLPIKRALWRRCIATVAVLLAAAAVTTVLVQLMPYASKFGAGLGVSYTAVGLASFSAGVGWRV